MAEAFSARDLARLADYDTPTMCNALEVMDPRWRISGFTTRPMVCQFPDMKPVVGYARTARIASTEPNKLQGKAAKQARLDYYRYIESGGPRPSICVLQDLDGDRAGFGAFWGEVQSNVHKGLGCLGVVTDGSIRDTHVWAKGFQALAGMVVPSHAWVHAVDFGGEANVFGMRVKSGDIVHADRHGAVIVPPEAVKGIPAVVDRLVRREAVIIGAAKKKGFSFAKLAKAIAEADEIH
jgi:regulator of RNase E activity RraA